MKYANNCLFREGFNLDKLEQIFANLENEQTAQRD